MQKVCFLIPASPTCGFFSQIAAFKFVLGKLNWSRWKPSILACFGGEADAEALEAWKPYLHDVTMIFAPNSGPEENPFYYAQIDGLFRAAPDDADVLARMDADTLPVSDLEDLLDYVVKTSSIAGVMAHFAFPVKPPVPSREAWAQAAQGLLGAELDFRYSYSLAEASLGKEYCVAPFYLNDGAVFFPKSVFRDYAEHYLAMRPKLMERLTFPYFSGQIALALAVAELRARTCALPMRYNFPNDELATKKFPEELQSVKIFHYLRTDQFDRQLIFAEAHKYKEFLRAPLSGANKKFQQCAEQLIGAEFPFVI
jgi:hypothetical protein